MLELCVTRDEMGCLTHLGFAICSPRMDQTIYTHVLNRAGRGVQSPADRLAGCRYRVSPPSGDDPSGGMEKAKELSKAEMSRVTGGLPMPGMF